MSMEQLEAIIFLLTFGSLCLTIVKIARKHTKWYWNLAPFGCGATTILWIAKIFA